MHIDKTKIVEDNNSPIPLLVLGVTDNLLYCNKSLQ